MTTAEMEWMLDEYGVSRAEDRLGPTGPRSLLDKNRLLTAIAGLVDSQRLLAGIVHTVEHVLDDWAEENAQTGEVTLTIPAHDWKRINDAYDRVDHDDVHAILGIGDARARKEST